MKCYGCGNRMKIRCIFECISRASLHDKVEKLTDKEWEEYKDMNHSLLAMRNAKNRIFVCTKCGCGVRY